MERCVTRLDFVHQPATLPLPPPFLDRSIKTEVRIIIVVRVFAYFLPRPSLENSTLHFDAGNFDQTP